ncbi:hypothetical protein P7C71_g4148, partial [Lecanoromycetidae sp. Uapishka_2]
MAIGIAVLGSGIIARNEHLPAIEACSLLSLKAVYSRSRLSARNLAQDTKHSAKAYFDSPPIDGHSLDDLLGREDVDAVIIALPIQVQPGIIRRAIAARKHVLSERPIAEDVETAEELIRWFREQSSKNLWSVGENFRFFEPLAFGAEQVRKMRGEVITFSVKMYDLIDKEDESCKTAWRQDPEHQGGFLLDGGISFIAGLRSLLGAVGLEITHVAAFTSLIKKHLAPSDTVHATVQINNGNSGTFSLSFGAEFKHAFEIQVVTEKMVVTVRPTSVAMMTQDNKRGQTSSFKSCTGIRQEVAAFAQSIKTGNVDSRGTPEQALMDLKVLQAMLESSKEAGKVKAV